MTHPFPLWGTCVSEHVPILCFNLCWIYFCAAKAKQVVCDDDWFSVFFVVVVVNKQRPRHWGRRWFLDDNKGVRTKRNALEMQPGIFLLFLVSSTFWLCISLVDHAPKCTSHVIISVASFMPTRRPTQHFESAIPSNCNNMFSFSQTAHRTLLSCVVSSDTAIQRTWKANQ